MILINLTKKQALNFVLEAISYFQKLEQSYLDQGFTREVGGSIGIQSDGSLRVFTGVPSFNYTAIFMVITPSTQVSLGSLPEKVYNVFGEEADLSYREESGLVDTQFVSVSKDMLRITREYPSVLRWSRDYFHFLHEGEGVFKVYSPNKKEWVDIASVKHKDCPMEALALAMKALNTKLHPDLLNRIQRRQLQSASSNAPTSSRMGDEAEFDLVINSFREDK